MVLPLFHFRNQNKQPCLLTTFSNLRKRFQNYLRPPASIPTPSTPSDVNIPANTECNYTTMDMSSPEYNIATRAVKFVDQSESMNRDDLLHMAQELKLYEKSGFDPSEAKVFTALLSASAYSILVSEPSTPSVLTSASEPNH